MRKYVEAMHWAAYAPASAAPRDAERAQHGARDADLVLHGRPGSGPGSHKDTHSGGRSSPGGLDHGSGSGVGVNGYLHVPGLVGGMGGANGGAGGGANGGRPGAPCYPCRGGVPGGVEGLGGGHLACCPEEDAVDLVPARLSHGSSGGGGWSSFSSRALSA